MKIIAAVAFALLTGIGTYSVAKADTVVRLEAIVNNNPAAPAQIATCGEKKFYPLWTQEVDFVNQQPSTLKAVKIRFETLDAFDAVLQTDDIPKSGTFTTGAHIKGSWTTGADNMPAPASASKVRCSIVQTLAVDGTAWKQ